MSTVSFGCSGRNSSPASSARRRAWILASRTPSPSQTPSRYCRRASEDSNSRAFSKISFSRLGCSAITVRETIPTYNATCGADLGQKYLEILFQFLEWPGAGIGPGALGGAFGDSQQPRRLDIRQPGEKAELDQLRADRVPGGQFFERFVQGHKLSVVAGESDIERGQVDALPFPAVLEAPLAAGILNEDAGASPRLRPRRNARVHSIPDWCCP